MNFDQAVAAYLKYEIDSLEEPCRHVLRYYQELARSGNSKAMRAKRK